MKRTITLLLGAVLGALWLAAPAHATPVPAPSPDTSPTASTPADPCVFPTPSATIVEEGPQAGLKTLDMRGHPKLPPEVVHCFVTFKDLCEAETEVTLHNPLKGIAIKYRVGNEETTHTVGPGETELVLIGGTEPFAVWIVLDDEGSHKFLVTRHKWTQPESGCRSPSPSPTPAVTSEASEEPQLPVTGQDVGTQLAIGAGALGVGLVLAGGLGVVLWRRRRSAA